MDRRGHTGLDGIRPAVDRVVVELDGQPGVASLGASTPAKEYWA